MKKIYLALLLVSITISLSAQDFEADLKKMNETYNNLTKFYTEVNMVSYANIADKTPNYSQKGIIRMENNKFHYTFDAMTMMVNDKYSVIVQKQTNTIIYKELTKTKKTDVKEIAGMAEMDKVMSNYKSVQYNGLKNGVKHYTIYPKYTFEQAQLYLTPNGLITKIIYEYKSAEQTGVKKMVATFNKTSTAPTFSKSQFSETQFFKKVGKAFVPADKYKNYQLLKVSDYEG